MQINQLAETKLLQLKAYNHLRTLKPGTQSANIDLSSNDYLGLSKHPDILSAGYAFAQQFGAGSTGSRLLSGNQSCFEQLEQQLAIFKNSQASLVFNSGYQTNATALSALLSKTLLNTTPLVFTDRLIHASLHHACQLAGVRQIRFKHNDMAHLQLCLTKHATNNTQPKWIITESVFGMDGDLCPITELAQLAIEHHAAVYLDEAHATGVFGKNGSGLSTTKHPAIDSLKTLGNWVVMGTFSKAVGVSGGYLCCSKTLKQYLVNHCTGFVYSTAPSPFTVGAILKALELLPQLDSTRYQLLENSRTLRKKIESLGFNIGQSESQIIPIILNSSEKALSLQKHLASDNITVSAIRPPTVPTGKARIRLALHSQLTEFEINKLIKSLAKWANTQGLTGA